MPVGGSSPSVPTNLRDSVMAAHVALDHVETGSIPSPSSKKSGEWPYANVESVAVNMNMIRKRKDMEKQFVILVQFQSTDEKES